MSSKNLSRKQKRERNLQRKHKNAQDMIDAKLKVKRWLGLGGEYSTLELVVLASEKLGRQVHGKVHYNHQIKFIAKLIDNHVKPRSTHPELELDINNLQVLCEDCNVGKLNQWDTDWKA